MLEDADGLCGYTLAARDSRAFYTRYETEWRPDLCARYPAPQGDPSTWTRLQEVYGWYHHPEYFCPEPYEAFPSHLHIDLLPRAQGLGHGRRMMEQLLERLRERGSPGVHLGMWARNRRAYAFYTRLGFHELARVRLARGRHHLHGEAAMKRRTPNVERRTQDHSRALGVRR